MDDVADFLDDMPEEQRNTLSYGELLSKVSRGAGLMRGGTRSKCHRAVQRPGLWEAAVQGELRTHAQGCKLMCVCVCGAQHHLLLLGSTTTPPHSSVPQAVQQRQAAADAAAAQAAAEDAGPAVPATEAAAPAAAAPDAPLAAVLGDPEPAIPAVGGGAGLSAADELLLVQQPATTPAAGQEDVDDFLASVLASPSPPKPQLTAEPPMGAAVEAAAGLLAGAPPAAAVVAAAVNGAGPMDVEPAAVEPAAAPAAAAADGEEEEEVLPMTADHRRLLHWHWANLEYGCSARLEEVGCLLLVSASGPQSADLQAGIACVCAAEPPHNFKVPAEQQLHPLCHHSAHPRCLPRTGIKMRMPAALAAPTAWWWAATRPCSSPWPPHWAMLCASTPRLRR